MSRKPIAGSARASWRAACAGLAILLAAPLAFSEPTPWDQGSVTTLAVTLQRALREVSYTARRNPQVALSTKQRREQARAQQSLAVLVSTSQRLASQLRAGKDRDATLPTFRRLQRSGRAAETDGRRADVPTPTLDQVRNARALIDQLVPFYGSATEEEEAAVEGAADADPPSAEDAPDPVTD